MSAHSGCLGPSPRVRAHVARWQSDAPGSAQPGWRPCAGRALAQQRGVFGEAQPHGSPAQMVVPPPGGLVTLNWPPSAAARSARPARPVPPSAEAQPIPSSAISTDSRPPPQRAVTRAVLARAWRAMLASVSATK
ncbi:MAG: hypothetical protein ACRDOK_17230 [Streptosporangiaceae bacterium]